MASPRRQRGPATPKTAQVARAIRQDIEAGILRDGEPLPSSRVLAAQWGVSVHTITEACKTLADEGLLTNVSRSKRIVHAPDQSRRNELRTRTPHVVLIGGYAGSGKTELGRILVRETGWPLLDKDTLTRPVVEAALQLIGHSPNDRESQTYVRNVRPHEYEALLAAAIENVDCGNSAIVTAPFIREFTDHAWLSRVEAEFAAMKAKTTLVWVHCDPESMHTYIRKRGAARDAAKLNDWPGYLATIDVDFRPGRPYVLVDNSVSSAPLHAQAQDLLRAVLSE
jgi:DNA-binding transcriptional regulator YhcF (GntR family)